MSTDKLISKKMTDSFDITGKWSTDKNIPLTDWSVGTLHYRPGKVRLEIVDRLNHEAFTNLTGKNYHRVYGFANTGEAIILTDVHYNGGTIRLPGISTEIYSLDNFIITDEAADKIHDRYIMGSATFSMTYFDQWLPMPKYEIHRDDTNKEFSLTVGPLEKTYIAKLPIIGPSSQLERNEGSNFSHTTNELNLKVSTNLTITCIPESFEINDLVSKLQSLSDLMTILFGHDCATSYLHIASQDNLNINVFFSQHAKLSTIVEETIHTFDFSFNRLLVARRAISAVQSHTISA